MQHERLSRFSSMLAIFLFAMSALSFFKAGTYLFGFIVLIISFLNVIAIVFLKDKKKTVNVILNLLNAIAAGITAYDYLRQGTSYIQYIWMLTTFIFLTLSIFLLINKEGLKSQKRR
jgi:hypothetical protein